ncbi:MAG: 16S rRNA (guanine(966)-N(2))-methyltransferase RsmD [Comamonas sp.]|jgi:16S rRNA (guanine(966)-N(2))-methyltransferase RsmD|uniref:16S rRNA (guanine(966)-N(2))-methyltransferase RsmD n=1 Tax=Comamonas sp. TaxID=34028 RepID=UPI002822EEEF|nr:16S rRNA (guanine(966)-N(2))-methyltransferase RsmD [Comamonas sp.]MDR0212681.1 16S rRNA (guanine(966)-N(2))-methyltransferase RsmD [Comamonas sp.]
MSRSAIKLHTPAGRKALDKMIHEAERKAQESAALKPGRPGAKPAAAGVPTGAGEIRIIGGQWRRTRLAVAQKPGLRPTPDRVRETLFNWLGQDLTNWKVLDAFSGTGALGLEAASRGATSVIMNEQDAALVQQLQRLQQKLDARMLKIQRGDALSCLKTVTGQDLVLLDPPFEQLDLFEPALKAAMDALNDGGYIYLEAPEAWSEERCLELGLELHRYLKAGAVHAHLLKKQ